VQNEDRETIMSLSAEPKTAATTAANDQRAADLLAMIASGGKTADHGLEALFKMYASRMRAYFKKHRFSDEDASDLIQETFIKVNRSAQQFKGDAKPSTWIWSIARNCMLDQIRSTKDNVSIDEHELDIDAIMQAQGTSQSQAEISRDEDITDCVSRYFTIFAKDSPERASTLQLAVVEGWSMEELAEFLKRSPAATREYLSQCRKKLREYLLPCADLVGGGT
jgi:RNA polymerase sigma factor (sigma-70 family)